MGHLRGPAGSGRRHMVSARRTRRLLSAPRSSGYRYHHPAAGWRPAHRIAEDCRLFAARLRQQAAGQAVCSMVSSAWW